MVIVVKYDNIDFNFFKLENIQKIHGKTIIPIICYNAKEPVLIQTPKLFLPFVYDKTLKLTFANNIFDKQVSEFQDILEKLNNHIKRLFKTKFPQYKTIPWKPVINKDYIYVDSDKGMLLFDRFRQTVQTLETPAYVRSIINIESIWICDNKIGINIKCYQIQTFGNDIHLTGYGFIDDLNIIKCEYREEVKEIVLNPIESHTLYGKYYKMQKMGIPNEAIQHKMKLDGLNPAVLNYAPNTDISKIKEFEVKKESLLLSGIGGLKKVDPKTLIKEKLKVNNKGWTPPTVEELSNILSNLKNINSIDSI